LLTWKQDTNQSTYYYLTPQSSWEADSLQIPHLLWNLKIHYHIQESLPLDPILSQKNPVHTLTPYFFKIHFNITIPSTHVSPTLSLPFKLSNQNPVRISHLSHAYYMKQSYFHNAVNSTESYWSVQQSSLNLEYAYRPCPYVSLIHLNLTYLIMIHWCTYQELSNYYSESTSYFFHHYLV